MRGGKKEKTPTATKHTFIFGVTHVKEEGAAAAAATTAVASTCLWRLNESFDAAEDDCFLRRQSKGEFLLHHLFYPFLPGG